ncbi:MAG: RecQ family ATP-dependent DNA helicase [Myxococcota bacterium]
MTAVDTLLRDTFGFDALRAGQRDAIDRLLAGRSVLAVFPTGGGKSLCYQLPALLLDGLTLVVSPLIALMKDQIDFLQSKGVRAARLDSSLTADEHHEVWNDLRSGALRILYIAPERFQNERFMAKLRGIPIALLAIDEAHCISEWGHNFRPDYLKLAQIAVQLRAQRVLALTATATPAVAASIRKAFDIAPEDHVHTGFHRPNLFLRMTGVRAEDRDAHLLSRLRVHPPGASIVYVTQQKTAERLADRLSREGFAARAYHAGLDPEVRTAVQEWFMADPAAIVVATIAFGMGIDKSDIRYVFHYNLPKALESYAQEIGRAGRDGAPAVCELFASPTDAVTLENFSYGDTPTEAAVDGLVREVLALGGRFREESASQLAEGSRQREFREESASQLAEGSRSREFREESASQLAEGSRQREFDVSKHELSRTHDIRILVVSTLLAYLELEGVLAATAPFYDTYSFQPQRSSAEILARYDAERAGFLRRLLACSKKGRTWFAIDLTASAAKLGEPRQRLVSALEHLAEQGDLVLRVSGVRQGYRVASEPSDVGALVHGLYERFTASEQRDIERLRGVLALASQEGCITGSLLRYFGEDPGGPCGHCDRCAGEPVIALPPVPTHEFDAEDRAVVGRLVSEGHEALAGPRPIARLLCGLPSPAASRARLVKRAEWGRFDEVPFADVLSFVESLGTVRAG